MRVTDRLRRTGLTATPAAADHGWRAGLTVTRAGRARTVRLAQGALPAT